MSSAATRRARRSAPVAPHQRRLARSVADQANLILDPHEEVLAITEAVIETGTLTRAALGWFWPISRRVALLFTSRRLIEINVSLAGRRRGSRIRSFPWDGVPSFRIVDDWLEVRTWDEAILRWYLRDVPDPTVEGLLLKRVNLAVSTYVPSLSRTAPVLHCSSCGAPRSSSPVDCRRCGAGIRSPDRAGQLAVAAPGAGHLYAQRTVAAAGRAAVEVAAFAALAAGMLTTTDPWRVLAIALLGIAVLGGLKLHAVWSARLLTESSGAIGASANRWWRWAVPVGGLVSVAALVSPLLLVGALDQHIDWRLAFADSERAWTVTGPPFPRQLADIPGLQEVWTHRDGQWILVQAWPFAPFESKSAVRARVIDEWGVKGPPLPLGSHRVLQATGEARAPDGSKLDTSVVIILDDAGRDIHVLTTAVGPVGGDGAVDRLRQVVAKSFWVPS